MDYKKIKKLVSHYQRTLGTNDPKRIAEALDIHIAYMPLGNALGYYRYMKRIKWIFINEDIMDDESLVRMVMAHELGHAILHCKENCCFMAHHTLLLTSKIEIEANTFAAELLIPDSLIYEHPDMTKSQIARIAGYNEKIMDYKMI